MLDEHVLHQLCDAAGVHWDGNPKWRPSTSSVAWLRRTWGDRVDPTLISEQAARLSVSGTTALAIAVQPRSLIDLIHETQLQSARIRETMCLRFYL